MIGLGTLVNMACILLGGIGGLLFGRFLTERCRSMAMTACGVSLLFIGGAGTLQKMLIIEDGQLSSYGSIMLALCLTLGSLLGDLSISQADAVELLQNLPAGLDPERRAVVETCLQAGGKSELFLGRKIPDHRLE